MHKVIPGMRTITKDEDFPLSDITVVTLRNKGTYTVKYGFGDGFEELKEGETVSFEAGANTVFSSIAALRIEFKEPEVKADSDYAYLSIMFNRLTEASKAFANLLSK
jgi:hypothetical protein